MFENLQKIINSDFENELLKEAINNLNSNSRIRFSNFAFVIRELIDILLEKLANNDNLIQCIWYKKPQNSERPVLRSQRIRYIVQGGFAEGLFDLILNNNIDNNISNINRYFRDVLSKHVHLTEECLNYTKEEIEEKTTEFESIIDTFLSMIKNIRKAILDFLTNDIERFVTDSFLSEIIDDLDILSTHTRIDSIDDTEIIISTITSTEIIGIINGNVNVNLQYGSDREVRDGDGDVFEDSYPFKVPFTIDILPLNELFSGMTDAEKNDRDYILEQFIPDFYHTLTENLNIDMNNVNVDTDSFYE